MREVLKTVAKLVLGRGSMRSYSQFGEDAVLGALFRSQVHGTYVDIGAYHPTLYSNTYALYTKGWQGLVIDPNTRMTPLYRVFRPRDTFVSAAVGKEKGEGTYYAYADGAYNTLSKEQVAITSRRGIHPKREYMIPIQLLDTLVEECKASQIDFMNIDIEGLDLEVLKAYSFSKRPRVIAIEDHSFSSLRPQESTTVSFLLSKGYDLYAHTGLTLIFKDRTN